MRRGLAVLIVLIAGLLAARAYVLQVYGPGLRSEVQTVPSRVHNQLGFHGATYTPLSAISPSLQHAIIAIEDRRFYEHPGIDPIGTVRAAFVDLTQRHVDQGGSTLEEQLVKRALVPQDQTARAKLRTMVLAWMMDRTFSKAQVLEMYLNEAYYGQGAWGVGEAARVYFGTDAAHVTVPEAAFLAALPQAPTAYGAHPQGPIIQARQRQVVQDMEQQGYLTAIQEQAALQTHLSFALPNP